MSKLNEFLKGRYLAHPPAHDLAAAFETMNADVSLREILGRTPTGFVRAIAELMSQNQGRTSKTIARLARDWAAQFGMKKNGAEQEAFAVQSALARLRRTKERSRPEGRTPALMTPELRKYRLDESRRNQVAETAHDLFRTATHGHSTTVTLTDDPSQVGFNVTRDRLWNVYGGAFKGWSATSTEFNITVPRLWLTRVSRPGLAILDGLMTLDAQPLVSPHEGVEVYAATWAAQSRGCDVLVEQGVIARVGGVTFHGHSIRSAV